MSHEEIKNCIFPTDLYYRVDHNTWIRLNDDGTITVGMTDMAQTLAGNVLHATPQKVGKTRKDSKPIAIVESSKWVGPVKAPMAGVIVESNDLVKEDPGILNKSPYKQGWLVKMKPDNLQDDMQKLLTGAPAIEAYRAKMEAENVENCVHCEGFEI
ncbi:MAG: glycine cleavage system protein H [Candidatus Heimdallarchaeota archaeon]|nr:glycine cleavage system protein H [Candidatus Heimdallarchaeota archaeon]MDH5645332.1 glycine cleavage system protein H [Candidatus Heimdallarchaeota archaeon]